MKKIFCILSFITTALLTQAQQLHFTSQYIADNYLYNPAAAGMAGHGSIGATYRSMWSGIDGGPQTTMLYGDISLKKLKTGIAGYVYNDVEGKGNGWGGVLWVGDDVDEGGVRATGRNNILSGGNIKYGELSVEKFGGAAHGDFRFRLPSTNNEFHFVYGERGSENIIAKMTNTGLIIPKVSSANAVAAPQKAQISFDSTDSQFKGFNGSQWVSFGENSSDGSFTASGNGTATSFLIPHGLTARPSFFTVQATTADAANVSYVSADNTNIVVHYATAPTVGSANLSWNWMVKK